MWQKVKYSERQTCQPRAANERNEALRFFVLAGPQYGDLSPDGIQHFSVSFLHFTVNDITVSGIICHQWPFNHSRKITACQNRSSGGVQVNRLCGNSCSFSHHAFRSGRTRSVAPGLFCL